MRNTLLTFLVVAGLTGSIAVAKRRQTAGEHPEVIAAVAPGTYPAIARAANAHGDVIVEVQVNPQGEVVSAKMVSGHPLLQRVSEDAAKQWKFASLQGNTKERSVRLTFAYGENDQGQKPRYEFTTIFLPPYRVEVQAHPLIIN